MKRCVLFSNDAILVNQVRAWAKSIDQQYRIDIFPSFESFRTYRDASREGYRSEYYDRDIAEGPEGLLVRLLIVDADILGENPIEELKSLQNIPKELGLVSALEPPRLLVLDYEVSTIRPEIFQTDIVDSMVIKPLDRELFLQNVELLASEDLFVEPTFLFTAPTEMMIEVGKDTVVEELAEYGLVLRNPVAIRNGVFAAIHCEALGQGGSARVLGRVYRSRPHPTRPNEWIVNFLYFGITNSQLASVRRYVDSEQTMAKITKTAAKKLDLDLVAPPDRRFAVIDMNPDSLEKTVDVLEDGFKNAIVRGFSSFSRFQAEVLGLMKKTEPLASASVAQATSAQAKAFPGNKIYLTIRSRTAELIAMDPQFSENDRVFGRPQNEYLAAPNLWFSCIENEDKDQVVELIGAAERGVKAQAFVRMKDLSGQLAYMEAAGFFAKSGEDGASPTIRIDLTEISKETYLQKIAADAASYETDPNKLKFDAIFIDASLVASTAEAWLNSVTTLLRLANVFGPNDEPPKVIVLSDDKTWDAPEAFRQAGYAGYIFRPLDRRHFLLTMQALIPDLKWHRELDSVPHVKVQLPARLAKEVKLSELGEYGLTVEQKAPLRQGIIMKFFSPLFGDRGGDWIAARCRYSVVNEANGTHQSRFIFFGVSDEVFRRIRRWIREDYVSKKEGA